MTTAKLALCIDAVRGPKPPAGAPSMQRLGSWVLRCPTRLIDRAVCETDETTLQLLPYMSLHNDGQVFMYARGGAGGEARLHGLLSVGIGGHVDAAPEHGEFLVALLQREAGREYTEEVGGELTAPVQFTHSLFDPTNPVGRVHLGLYGKVECPTRELTPEAGMIDKGEWVDIDLLMRADYFARLEPWSKLVVEYLYFNKL